MKVLVVEDEPIVQNFIAAALKGIDFSAEIEVVANGDDALRRYIECVPYDLVITDHRHCGLLGIDLIEGIRANNGEQEIILQTGNSGEHLEAFKRKWKDIYLLQKPYPQKELQDLLNATMKRCKGIGC